MTPEILRRFFDDHRLIVHVEIATARGSTPREAGAEMFVSETAALGTIGGGALEYLAIEESKKLIAAQGVATKLDVPLGPEIGQCCGGRVSISLSRMSGFDREGAMRRAASQERARQHIYIMGGGHVGRALADFLQHLPFHTAIIDQRDTELELCNAKVDKRLCAVPEAQIKSAPPGSAFIVLTHDHGLDFLVTAAALERGDAAYVGLIGSGTKRARFEAWHRKQDGKGDLGSLVCPMGQSEIRDKRPQIIAAFIVAEVVAALACASRHTQSHTAQIYGVA